MPRRSFAPLSYVRQCVVFLSCAAICLHYPACVDAAYGDRSSNDRMPIAVLDFSAINTSKGNAVVVTEYVREAFVKSNAVTIVDKGNMDRVLAEQAFQQTGCTSEACAVKLGKILNVKKMVLGKYSVFEGTRILSAQVVDVQSGRMEASESEKMLGPEDVESAPRRLVGKLVGAIYGIDSVRPRGRPDLAPPATTKTKKPAARVGSRERLVERRKGPRKKLGATGIIVSVVIFAALIGTAVALTSSGKKDEDVQ